MTPPGEHGEWQRGALESTSMDEIIFVVEDAPDGGLAARAVGESIFTQAATMAELHDKVRDAVRCHFEVECSAQFWSRR